MVHSPSPSTSSHHHHHHSHRLHPFGGHISRHFHGDDSSDLAPDDAYLSYYDIRLTKEDYDSIRSEHEWLTDDAIAFWEEYIEHEILPQYPKARICLLRPSIAFMLMMEQDPASLRDALPPLQDYTHIFMPINDNKDVTHAEGGSHWTLLLASLIDGKVFHYDSLRPSNYEAARVGAYKLSQVTGIRLELTDFEDAPQQENGSDCGMFVCLNMKELLLKKLLRTERGGRVDMSLRGEKINAHAGRKEMTNIIDDLRRQAIDSRSRSRSRVPSQSPPRIGPDHVVSAPN